MAKKKEIKQEDQGSSEQVIGAGSATGGRVEREYIHEEEGSVAGGQMSPDSPGLTPEDKERIEKKLKQEMLSEANRREGAGTLSDLATTGGGGEDLGENFSSPSSEPKKKSA